MMKAYDELEQDKQVNAKNIALSSSDEDPPVF